MIAVDTSSMSRHLLGIVAPDTVLVAEALRRNEVMLPLVVLTELLSFPALRATDAAMLEGLSRITIQDGYWQRVGRMRAEMIRLGRKAKLGDALIAQSCIDHGLPLLTYDDDFRRFVPAGLKLVIEEV